MMERKFLATLMAALICIVLILTPTISIGSANGYKDRIEMRAIEGKLYMTVEGRVGTHPLGLLSDIRTETTLLSPRFPDPFDTPRTLVKSVKKITTYTSNTWEESPSFSPDGTKIVFESCIMGGDSPSLDDNIWIMDIDGNNKTRLTKNKYYDGFPSFSPDSTKIIYEAFSKGKSIFVMNSDGSNPKQVATGEPFAYLSLFSSYPSWSPDGSKIIFEKDFNIYVMDRHGSNLTLLSSEGVFDSHPSWSPDGNKILFISWKPKNNDDYMVSDIWTMNSDGSNRKQLTNDNFIEMEPFYSLTGDKIIFTLKDLANCDTMMTTFRSPDIGETEPIGVSSITLRRNITYSDGTKESTDYVKKTTKIEIPDGRKINFKSSEFGICTIWMMDNDGTTKQQLTSKYSAEQPRWSPNGTKIAFASNGDIWLMTLNVTPAATPTPEPMPTVTQTSIQLTQTSTMSSPTLTPTSSPKLTPIPTPTATATATEIPIPEEKGVPGFETIFAIAGLLAVVYLLRRRR